MLEEKIRGNVGVISFEPGLLVSPQSPDTPS